MVDVTVSSRAMPRWASLAGLVYVVLFVIGSLLMFDGPSGDDPPAKFKAFYGDAGHRDRINVGWVLAGLGLLDPPLSLHLRDAPTSLCAVSGGQVALTRPAALVMRKRVVVVAADGGPAAAGERTGRLPDRDQVPQAGRRPVGA